MSNDVSPDADVLVIGGGPAGMIAAYAAGSRGLSVILAERNPKLGKKLYITGHGRCNLTNAAGPESFFGAQRANPKFLYSAFHHFSNRDLMELMESHGLRLKVERGGRVFPVSDHASDVTATLAKLLSEAGVSVRLDIGVYGLRRAGDIFITGTGGGNIISRNVIVATGGLTYPATGSTGDGYKIAESFGITLKPRYPALCSLMVRENAETARMAGLTLKNVNLRLNKGGETLCEGQGEMLFTHTGLGGPLALTASSHIAGTDTAKEDISAHIDLKPALTPEMLDRRILREIDESPDKSLKNLMRRLLPSSLIDTVISRSNLDPYMRCCDLRRAGRLALLDLIKDLTYNVTGTGGFDEAVVTRGGVAVNELNPRTMESRRVPGLYFAGEVIDIDALTGGFNLQNAFSTGFTAGDSVGRGE